MERVCSPPSLQNAGAGHAILAMLAAGITLAPAVAQSPVESTPEQVQGHALDGAAAASPRDLFSVGMAFTADVLLPDGAAAAVVFNRFEFTGAHLRIVVTGRDGERQVAPPDLAMFDGAIEGIPGSVVFLASGPFGVGGCVRLPEGTFALVRDDGSLVLRAAPAPERAGPAPGHAESAPLCGTDHFEMNPALLRAIESARARGTDGAAARGDMPCRVVDLAVDTDWEFTNNLFAGNTDASAAYALTLMGAASSIYRRDLNVTLRIVFLRLWETESDPYRVCGAFTLLFRFRDYWNANMSGVERDLAHLLSARVFPEAAGVASLGGLCASTEGGTGPSPYGISTRLNGYFPMPPADHQGQNLDLYLVTHEIGHGFGAVHTNLLDPPQDDCPSSCANAGEGTIMSLCYLCPGAFENIALTFHPRTIAENIAPFLDAVACDLATDSPDCNPAPGSGAIGSDVRGGAAPEILEPVHLARSLTRTPTLRWSAASETESYSLRLDDDADLKSPIFEAGTSLTEQAVPAGLLAGRATYYWSVIAHTPGGDIPSIPPVATFVVAVEQCDGDADLSGEVDFLDVMLILSRWGFCGAPGDANEDGRIDMHDLLAVLFNFSAVCE